MPCVRRWLLFGDGMAESDPLSLLASSALVKPEPLHVTRTALEVYRTRVDEAPAAMAAASAELAASAERAATVAAEAAAVAVRIQTDAAMARQFNTVERTRLQKGRCRPTRRSKARTRSRAQS